MQPSTLSPSFFCDVRPDRDRAIVALAGELDLDAAPRVAAAVDDLIGVGFTHVVVDLRELTFLDSAGLQALLSARGAAEGRGCALSLVPGPRAVQQVFELTATDSLFRFDDVGGTS